MVAKTHSLASPIVVDARPATPVAGTASAPQRRLHTVMDEIDENLAHLLAAFSDDSTPDLMDGIYDQDEDPPQSSGAP